jgi:hypothetical protein
LLAYVDVFGFFAIVALMLAPLALILLRAHPPSQRRVAH